MSSANLIYKLLMVEETVKDDQTGSTEQLQRIPPAQQERIQQQVRQQELAMQMQRMGVEPTQGQGQGGSHNYKQIIERIRADSNS